VGVLLVAACGGSPGAPSASAPATSVGPDAGATSGITASPPVSASPSLVATASAAAATASPLAGEPPAATLAAADGSPADGALGSYTWGEAGSDSPWIVVRASDVVRGTGPWSVAFTPDVPVAAWRAAWAPIADGTAGPIALTAGGSGAISFDGPTAGGPWSLRLEVEFEAAGRASWYWRVATP
jgi:hypothetical protein